MKITDFSRFREEVTMLGIPIIAAKIARNLRDGAMDIERADVVCGTNGLYGLIEREGDLFVTQIILHIADKQIKYVHRYGGEGALRALRNKEYDTPELLKTLHKYHFWNCKTLQGMFANKRRDRYKQSHRQDGKFRYRFVENDKIIDRREQTLNVCQNCFNWLNQQKNFSLTQESFLPANFFENVDSSLWLPDCGYEMDDVARPDKYPDDFKKISKEVRERKGYRCEQCGIDLNTADLREYADCHHKNANKGDNRLANLSCICVKCHAEQYMHGHLKQSPRYQRFLPVWDKRH